MVVWKDVSVPPPPRSFTCLSRFALSVSKAPTNICDSARSSEHVVDWRGVHVA
jgi:hypothetical protein